MAQLSVLQSKEQDARLYIAQAVAIDPDDAEVLNILGTVQRDYDYNYDVAVKTLQRAVRQEPGNANIWNDYGLALGDQGDTRGAAQAFERALALDPYDPVPAANYAILLLDNNQLDAAEKQFNHALEVEPSFYAALLAKGRWQIQRGDITDAKNTFLDSVAAEPTVSESTQGLAIAYYEAGDVKRAQQQLDAAERLDPNDPLVPLIRTVIALDESEADTALVNARESIKRYRARGGVYDALAQSRTDGSYLNNAFNKLGLADWSRYYGDLLYSPFNSSSLFYEATALQHQAVFTDGAPGNANAMAALTQGILLDPLSVSSRNRFTDLFRRPFLDVTAGGSMTMSDSGEVGWGADGDVEGFINKGLPLAFSLTYGHTDSDPWRRDSFNNTESANLYIGTAPTLDDHIVLWGRFSDLKDDIPHAALQEGVVAGSSAQAVDTGIGYSHSFGARNNVNAVFEATTGDASHL
jgi:Flp pilus assembly protein TadD